MPFFILILLSLFFMQEASAVKDLPDVPEGQMAAFITYMKGRPNKLREVSDVDYKRIRGHDFYKEMLRRAEMNLILLSAKASSFNVLEDLWRENNPSCASGTPINDNIILIDQAFGIVRLAGMFAIDGYKPLEEDLVSWRNFILTKLRVIVERKLGGGCKEHFHKWGIFQRHARTYIGLILGDVGDRGLHEAQENKQQLFQEAWEAFGEAQKFSESKNLDLFKLYLIALKNFTPQGYDEASKKIEIDALWSHYNTTKTSTAVPQFLKKEPRRSFDDETQVVRALGPERKGSCRSKGANLQTQIEAAFLSLRYRNFHEHADTAEASGAIPGEDGESGAHGREDEDDGGHDQHMYASGSSEDLEGLGLGGAFASPPRGLFSGSIGSPQTPMSSFSNISAPPNSLMSPLGTPGRLSFSDYLRQRGLIPSENAGVPSMDFGQRTVSDPLATLLNVQGMPSHASRDEDDQQDGNVLAGAPLDFSEPMRTDQLEKREEDSPTQRQKMVQEVPSSPFSGAIHAASAAARAEALDEEEDESDSDDDGSMSHEEEQEDDDSEEELENDGSQSDDDASEEESEERGAHKKPKLIGSNEKIRAYMEENSENLRKDLLELRDIKLWTVDQLLKEIEARSKQKFSGPSTARQILHVFLDEKDTPSNQALLSRYMKDHHEDLVIKIKSWIKRALKKQEQLSTRGIAERIVEEGKLKVKIFSSQVKSVWSFLKDNKIDVNGGKVTVTDVLNDQEEDTLKRLYERFDRIFNQGLSSGKYKRKNYVPLLTEKLEAFVFDLQGEPLRFKNEVTARSHIMKYLSKFDLVLPGKIKKTPMIAFLKDRRNKEFIRAQLIKIAPRWASEMNKDALITQFEKAASQHTQKECKFSKHSVGYNRLNILLNENTVKEDGIYKLKSPKKRERKRKHVL